MILILEIGPRLEVVLGSVAGFVLVGFLVKHWWMTYAILKGGR